MFKQISSDKVYTQIMNQIKVGISNGELKRGDRLPSERVMAEQLGVSRATVREAIRSLEIMGLVQCNQGEGNFITNNLENSLAEPVSIMFQLNQGKINEINELRRALEFEAVKLATNKISDTSIYKLEELCSILENSKKESERAEADRKFHYEIAKASGNILIINILNAASFLIEDLIKDIRFKIMVNEENVCKINQQHRSILKAIKLKKPDKAVCCMRAHMDYVNSFIEGYNENQS
ncbi:MAG: FadR family transcriptional regulator [Firmicutes bacterium HGW-Firmicutes-12]|jgi:GntR family transcriptional repressor for pyruvate dehydrogenase complex|nr:MAG: FadR family transcriptional regulator [Firmicutes bacterium HGW-Firmicutes-12]